MEISDVRDGTHDSPKFHTNGFPLITSKNLLSNGKLSFENVNFISEEDFHSINKRSKVDKGDILFGMIGTIGNPVRVEFDEFAIKNVALIKEVGSLLNSFLIYYLSTSRIYKQFYKYNAGGTQKFIALGLIRNLDILIPSLKEQKKIANFMSLIDKKIELMEKKYKTLQKYKSALIQQIFTQNIRFNNFDNNWNQYSLGELGETYSGLNGLSKENFESGTSKFIPYKVIFDNEVIDINSLEPVQLNNKKQEPVKKGDLFFTGSSETPEEVGMVSVLNQNIENCYLNSFCFGYRLNDFMKVNPLFLSYLLRSPLIRRKIKVLGQGSTRFNISKKEIMKLTVEIPSLEEQKKIITLLENLTNNIHFMKNKNSKIKEFKKYLLQQMFV